VIPLLLQLCHHFKLQKNIGYDSKELDSIQTLKEEIEKVGAILAQKNIDIQTVEEYTRLEEELQKYGLSMESTQKLVSVLLKLNLLGYDALKIVSFMARIKSLKGY
jgi:hypothetical protein